MYDWGRARAARWMQQDAQLAKYADAANEAAISGEILQRWRCQGGTGWEKIDETTTSIGFDTSQAKDELLCALDKQAPMLPSVYVGCIERDKRSWDSFLTYRFTCVVDGDVLKGRGKNPNVKSCKQVNWMVNQDTARNSLVEQR